MMKKTNGHSDGMKLQGFFRVQITEDGKGVIGDSGWKKNKITNLGIKEYLVTWLLSGSGGKYVTHMQLGTGSAPASDATSLNGEITGTAGGGAGSARQAVTSSLVDSGTAQFTGAFASANSFVTQTENISNIGLFNTATIGAGTLFAGNTFASSSCATNQSVNAKLTWHISQQWGKVNSSKSVEPSRSRDNTEPSPYYIWEGVTNGWRAPISNIG